MVSIYLQKPRADEQLLSAIYRELCSGVANDSPCKAKITTDLANMNHVTAFVGYTENVADESFALFSDFQADSSMR